MALRALLVSADDRTIAVLTSVLSDFAVTTQHCVYPAGMFRPPDYPLDLLVVDFDNPDQATSIAQSVGTMPSPPVIVAILREQDSLRSAFAAGANFALYKSISRDVAHATLQAAIALIKQERRRCFRVPIQVPAQLELEDGIEKEGIVLDLSEEGIDLLTAEPICPTSALRARFTLPASQGTIELRGEIVWANPNGQSGMRFIEVSENGNKTLKEFVHSNSPDFLAEDAWQDSECRLTDLSLDACYVETQSPFPEHSIVQISLKANETEVSAEGAVQVMHPGVGMGIEFACRTFAQCNEVQDLLNFLTSRPGTLPKLTITPRALCTPDNFTSRKANISDDPLLRLLRNHESFSQEEFFHELRQQRTSHEAVIA